MPLQVAKSPANAGLFRDWTMPVFMAVSHTTPFQTAPYDNDYKQKY